MTDPEKTVAHLVALAESNGWADGDLDDVVYDAAVSAGLAEVNATDDEEEQEDQIGNAERSASDTNNEGLEGQIRFLLASGALREGELEAMLSAPPGTAA
jgi:ribonuclease PH